MFRRGKSQWLLSCQSNGLPEPHPCLAIPSATLQMTSLKYLSWCPIFAGSGVVVVVVSFVSIVVSFNVFVLWMFLSDYSTTLLKQ